MFLEGVCFNVWGNKIEALWSNEAWSYYCDLLKRIKRNIIVSRITSLLKIDEAHFGTEDG